MQEITSLRSTSIQRLRQGVSDFFYRQEVPFGLAIVRMFLPIAILLPTLQRWTYVRELYSTDGAPAQISIGYGYGTLFPEFSGGVAVALYTALIVFLITSSIGWMSRISVPAATILYTYFTWIDSISTITKYTVIATDALVVLSVSACGSVWSVDAWLRKRKTHSWSTDAMERYPRSSAWPRRLIQLLIATVYFGAAFTKIHTPEFFSGDQLRYWMITHVNFSHRMGEYMAMHPALLVVSAYTTIIWEMLFLFMAWRGIGRIFFITVGVFFHTMTCFTLGLYIFPLVCISLYFAFLNENDVRFWAARFRYLARQSGSWTGAVIRKVRSWQLPSPEALPLHGSIPGVAVFGMVLGTTVLAGMEAEYRLDRYGVRRAEGMHPLTRLDRDEAIAMLQDDSPIRESDKFFSFDLGTVTISGILANRRTEFQYGETIVAQCYLNPPHEDMWVECNLHDAKDRIVDRSGMVVPREMLRCNYSYMLGNKLEPGEYSLVIKSRGEEVMRRSFELSGEPPVTSQMAN